MSNLRKLNDPNLSPEEQDAILQRAIRAKFDRELREEWAAKLRDEHNVSRGAPIVNIRGRRNFLLTIAAVAASIVLTLIVFNPFSSSDGEARELAMNYLEQVDKFHYGSGKGAVLSDDEIRIAAVHAYNDEHYPEAIRYFSSIQEPTDDDAYYSAMASLFNQDWADAVAKYENILSNTTNEQYRVQAGWYRIIALVMTGNEAQAREMLGQYTPEDKDYYAKAQQLLKAIE